MSTQLTWRIAWRTANPALVYALGRGLRADIEVPNRSVDVSSEGQLACYPWGHLLRVRAFLENALKSGAQQSPSSKRGDRALRAAVWPKHLHSPGCSTWWVPWKIHSKSCHEQKWPKIGWQTSLKSAMGPKLSPKTGPKISTLRQKLHFGASKRAGVHVHDMQIAPQSQIGHWAQNWAQNVHKISTMRHKMHIRCKKTCWCART